MSPTLTEGLLLLGVPAVVGLLWRLTVLTSRQNGSLSRVVQNFDDHCAKDREDFQRVFDKIDGLRED